MVTPRRVVTRDSESFGLRFWGPKQTCSDVLGPQGILCETESAAERESWAKTLRIKAKNEKRREALALGVAGNRRGGFAR